MSGSWADVDGTDKSEPGGVAPICRSISEGLSIKVCYRHRAPGDESVVEIFEHLDMRLEIRTVDGGFHRHVAFFSIPAGSFNVDLARRQLVQRWKAPSQAITLVSTLTLFFGVRGDSGNCSLDWPGVQCKKQPGFSLPADLLLTR